MSISNGMMGWADRERFSKHASAPAIWHSLQLAIATQRRAEEHVAWLRDLWERRNAEINAGIRTPPWPAP